MLYVAAVLDPPLNITSKYEKESNSHFLGRGGNVTREETVTYPFHA